MRKLFYKTKSNVSKNEINHFFKIIDQMEQFKKKQNILLLELIKNFDENFYKNPKNRAIIIYYIYYIYHDFDEEKII